MLSQSFLTPTHQGTGKLTVYVIDDDQSMRRSLSVLLRSAGLCVETFSSAQEFLDFRKPNVPSCLILDVILHGENGLSFQEDVTKNGIRMPIVFMTGYADIEMTVKAMKAGALDFFAKPFREQDMLDAVAHALERDRERLEAEESVALLRNAYESLTKRECEIVTLVVAGLLNKQIAAEMDLSEITVKVHRGNAMRKLAAGSVADLVRKAEALGVVPKLTRFVDLAGRRDEWTR
ncbi:response regulator [Paraburkholderia sp. RL18-103-BIB-C]|jgi:FixJ family two-component response regulator|uniref:response regulator transcription factor n=1 Tax=unclassified Paraburkholderia TaxID=2615204 RepID=UPI0038B6E362